MAADSPHACGRGRAGLAAVMKPAARSCPGGRLRWQRRRSANRVAMTAKTEDAVRARRHAARASRGDAGAGGEQLSRADRVARGKDARAAAPLVSHAQFTPDQSRDPVGLLLEQEKSRVP